MDAGRPGTNGVVGSEQHNLLRFASASDFAGDCAIARSGALSQNEEIPFVVERAANQLREIRVGKRRAWHRRILGIEVDATTASRATRGVTDVHYGNNPRGRNGNSPSEIAGLV